MDVFISGHLYFSNIEDYDDQDNKLYKCSVYNRFLQTTVDGSFSTIKVSAGMKEMIIKRKHKYVDTLSN